MLSQPVVPLQLSRQITKESLSIGEQGGKKDTAIETTS
jgi:hypothetical protein